MAQPMYDNEPSKNLENNAFSNSQDFAQLRLEMLKFANLQLQDECMAEDAVQEAMLAAHKNINKFAGKSAFKTWVFAILKHKIIDVLRKQQKHQLVGSLSDENEETLDASLFDGNGHWQKQSRPENWCEPMEAVKNDHFWQVFDACLNHLPDNLSRAFMMREFIELETDEICQTLEISSSNLYVVLYRARLRLRECLENNWFAGEAQ